MKKLKLRTELLNRLEASSEDDLLDVILELDKPEVTAKGRQERIALLKESFAQTAAPVAKAVENLGGHSTNAK